MAAEQLVGPHDIPVRSYRVEIALPAARAGYAGYAGAARFDRSDGIAEPERSAEPLEVPGHAFHELVGAPLGEPHAAVSFELVDERIDRAGGHRVAADQQRVKGERLA